MTFAPSNHFNAFITTCRAKKLAQTTHKWYSWVLDKYEKYTREHELQWNTTEAIESFLADLTDMDMSAYTIHAYFRVLRRFFRWMKRRRLIVESPLEFVETPRLPQPLPRGISEETVNQLVESIDTSTWQGKRDQAIIIFLWDTGVRASELCNLTLADLNMNRRTAMIRRGKENKDRLVSLGQRAHGVLKEWFSVRGDLGCSHVFVSRVRRPMTRTGLADLLEERSKAAAIEGPYNPHAFRHGFAIAYLDHGGKLHNLQYLLGHSSLRSTEVYLRATGKGAVADHAKASPGDHLPGESNPEGAKEVGSA